MTEKPNKKPENDKLRQCPSCDREIRADAEDCPACDFPVEQYLLFERFQKLYEQRKRQDKEPEEKPKPRIGGTFWPRTFAPRKSQEESV